MSSGPSKPPTSPPPSPDWRKLHLWHIQPVRDILILLIVLGIIHVGYILSPITVPMLLALALAYLFEPLIKRLTRRGLVSRPGAVVGIMGAAFLFVVVPFGIGAALAGIQGVRLATDVAANTRNLIQAVQGTDQAKREAAYASLRPSWQDVAVRLRHLQEEAADPTAPPTPADPTSTSPSTTPANPPSATDPDHPATKPYHRAQNVRRDASYFLGLALEWLNANTEEVAKTVGQRAISTGSGAISTAYAALASIASIGFGLFLTSVFFFFFSTGWGKVLEFWASLIPDRKKGKVFDLMDQMDRVIAGFIRGRLTICAILALYMTIAFWIIGVPVPLIVGACVGLLYLVPFLHIISVPVAILLLWLQPSSIDWQTNWWWIIGAPIVVDLSGQFIDDWILSPMIQGKVTNMDTPTILFASMAGGLIGGMYGLLVAIPVAACIRILIRELVWPRFRNWARGQAPDPLPLASAPPDTPAKPS